MLLAAKRPLACGINLEIINGRLMIQSGRLENSNIDSSYI
jgi:hypothetical protein